MSEQQQYHFIPKTGNVSLKRRVKRVGVTTEQSSSRKYHITKTWISGEKTGTNGMRFKGSVTMIIPKLLCDKYGFSAPSHVMISDSDDGILIKPVIFDDES